MTTRRMRSQRDAAVLAPPRQASDANTSIDSGIEKSSAPVVSWGTPLVAKVSTHNRPQPLALFGEWVHAFVAEARLSPHSASPATFPYRLPQHREPSIAPLLHADMRKAEKGERLRLPFSSPLPAVDRMWTELQKSRLLGVQFQVELPHSLSKLCPKLIGVRFLLKPEHDIVRKTHHDHVARTPASDATLGPRGRIQSGGKRWPATAMHFRPVAFLLPHVFRFPSSNTPALSHFWISRTTRRSAIRCSTNFTSHSWGKPIEKVAKYPDRAPSSPFWSAVPCRARPALDAGFARTGTHTRIRENPFS